MPAVIFSGAKVKALKNRLSLNDVTEIISVATDPSTGGGLTAPIGSIAMDYVTGKVYKKISATATDWKEIGGGFNITSAIQSITASGTITVNIIDGFQALKVQSATPGGGEASTTPFGSLSFVDGQQMTLIGQSDDYPLTILYADVAKGFLLNGEAFLGRGKTLTVIYDSGMDRFVEVSRNA